MILHMVEVLAVFGVLGWLAACFCAWLSSLPFFPALAAAALVLPFLAIHDYGILGRRWRLQGWKNRRQPVPPERFYWSMVQPRLKRVIIWNALAALAGWWNAATLPAEWSVHLPSMVGWSNALVGTWTGARLVSAVVLFVRAAQWFDAMRPNVVGLWRHAMYRLSDNYEYLGEQRRDPEKERVY
jgi:hypothetical protein